MGHFNLLGIVLKVGWNVNWYVPRERGWSILGSINSMADMDRCNEKSGCWTIPPMGNSWLRRTSNGVTSFHVVAVSVDAMVVVDCWHGGVLLECITLKTGVVLL